MKFDITYIFSGGRTKNISLPSSSDFFYGFKEYIEMGINITFIEISDSETSIFDKIIIKITKLPLYLFKSLSKKNFNVLVNSKNLVFINESSFISFLPIIFICKKFYNVNINYLPMGLVDKYLDGNWISKKIIKICFKYADNILFIGKGELGAAEKNIRLCTEKYKYVPFSVDIDHWSYKEKTNVKLKDILFIGNDQNRDFQLLYSIAKKYEDLNFTIVTNYDKYKFAKLENVKFLQGNWRDNILSDNELLNLYHNADLVILPLKNSTQPSGQSVAIQSMSSGTPVIMTKTIGFWDNEKYIDSENIFFVDDQKLETWDIKFNQILSNLNNLASISKKARKLVEDEHNLNKFILNLNNYLVDIEL